MTQHNEIPQSGFSPVVRLLGSKVLSVVLMGGYSLGVYTAAVDSGTPMALGVAVLASPFALVGLVMLWSTGVNFLTLFNPRATLKINNSTIRPGQTLQLRWEITGATEKIQSVEISLNGFEKNEAVREKPMQNISRIRDLFQEIKIFSTTSPLEIERGQTSWTVPEDIKLSTGAAPMEWTLRLRGTISTWPDVYDEVDICIVDHI